MTVEEAKRKWCPMARTWVGQSDMGINRTINGEPANGTLCIADRCMMWVWLVAPDKRGCCGLAPS